MSVSEVRNDGGGAAVMEPPEATGGDSLIVGADWGQDEEQSDAHAGVRLQPERWEGVREATSRTFAIVGAGEVGRNILRLNALLERDGNETLAIANIADSALTREKIVDLLKNDPARGRMVCVEVRPVGRNAIQVGKQEIEVLRYGAGGVCDWGKRKIWGVFEATGARTDGEKAKEHIEIGGAKKVLITAPASGDMPVKSLVVGFNEGKYDPDNDHVVANASDVTRSALHPLRVLRDLAGGLWNVVLWTIHAETGEARRKLIANMGKVNDISELGFRQQPTCTRAALENFFPGVSVDATEYRVPVPDGSVSEIVVTLKRSCSLEEIRNVICAVQRWRIMDVREGKLGDSRVLIGNPHDAVVFKGSLGVEGNVVHLTSVFDNVYASAAAAHDLMAYMAKQR